ncbi:hypothetical protein C5167_028176 [Papaver somniferum]|nr:hypothetical protein C5167_028176 [Papaver somniferum]
MNATTFTRAPNRSKIRLRVSLFQQTTITTMANDAVLRSSLICLGAIIFFIGFYTYSFKKMIVTYIFGLFAIAGIILPDWEFFDRDFSEWTSPMPADAIDSNSSEPKRFKIYPVRYTVYAIVYSFGLYKWWNFVST